MTIESFIVKEEGKWLEKINSDFLEDEFGGTACPGKEYCQFYCSIRAERTVRDEVIISRTQELASWHLYETAEEVKRIGYTMLSQLRPDLETGFT